MTLNELKELDSLCNKIKELEDDLKNSYDAVRSPSTESIGSHGNSVSNPTETAAFSAIQLQQLIAEKNTELDSKKSVIQAWLNTIDDSNIRRCIKYRFFYKKPDGRIYKWEEISQIVYPGYSEHVAKTYVYRYLKK